MVEIVETNIGANMTDTLKAQEIFDTSVGGVIAQGGPSSIFEYNSLQCLYRSPDGKKCAAGQLIPDEAYKPEWEGKRWSAISNYFPELQDFSYLIQSIQSAHDDVEAFFATPKDSKYVWSMDLFKEKAQKIALDHNLEWKF